MKEGGGVLRRRDGEYGAREVREGKGGVEGGGEGKYCLGCPGDTVGWGE